MVFDLYTRYQGYKATNFQLKRKRFKEKLLSSKNTKKKQKQKKQEKKIEKKQIHIPSNPRHLKSQLHQSIAFCPSLLRYVLYERPTEFRRYYYNNNNNDNNNNNNNNKK